jgi:hypothetical protein
MPETGAHEGGAAGAPAGPAETGLPVRSAAETRPRAHWFYYGLGLSLQTFLWFLLFLAIVVAVLVGNKLTEFRYVGF